MSKLDQRRQATHHMLRPCTPEDAADICGIYNHYVRETVIVRLSMKILIPAVLSLIVGAAFAQTAPSDWLIVPGDRIGPITKSTSEVMLQAMFGSENVESIDVNLGEGFTERGTAVYPNDVSRRLEILWSDASRTFPREIHLTGDLSDWKTAEGISLGSTLEEIERLNGFPFRLVGFAFDYGGTITDCGRGRLTMLGCSDSNGDSRMRQILLRLAPAAEARRLPEYRQVIGDRDFSSGHPAMQALNPRVYELIWYSGEFVAR